MYIKSIKIENFRNIEFMEIFPHNEINVIYGQNGQGKTNLLEAIWLFTGCKSFRNSKDNEFIKFGEKNAKISVDFQMLGVDNEVSITFSDKKIAYLNDKKLQNTSNLAGKYNAIIFSPSDLTLVTDGPDKRRRFLDIAIGQLYPNYIEILKNYSRAVMQRNKIIKDYRYDKTVSIMLEVFENEIVDMGNKISKYRKRYIEILNKIGYSNIERLTYTTDVLNTEDRKSHVIGIYGKRVCETLRTVRQAIIDSTNIEYQLLSCEHTRCESGTCPACEKELQDIENIILHNNEESK